MAKQRKPAPKKPAPAVSPENLNPYDFALLQFGRAADFLDLDAGTRQVLSTPKRQLIVSVPVKMDNKKIKVFTGYRVQHSITRGPSAARFPRTCSKVCSQTSRTILLPTGKISVRCGYENITFHSAAFAGDCDTCIRREIFRQAA